MNWLLLLEIVYIAVLILVCLRIIYDTRSTTKTLAYLLLAIFLPVAGIIFYFSFGTNYRKRKMYSKKLIENEELAKKLREDIFHSSKQTFTEHDAALEGNKELAHMLVKDTNSPLTSSNAVKLLINGENKFPEVIKALQQAKHHIHVEYYIYDDDKIGKEIEQVLIQKAKEGRSCPLHLR